MSDSKPSVRHLNAGEKVAQLEQRIDDPMDAIPAAVGDPFDTDNPRSLCNMVPRKVREAILNPELPRHYLQMPESQFLIHLEKYLEPRDYRIRLAFWDEYNAAIAEDRVMRIDQFVVKVTNIAYFYRIFLQNKYKVIFLLQPPGSYKINMRELLHFGLNRMREIISLPLLDKKGQPNVHLIREMIKIFALADARVQGAVKQTIDINQKSLNVDMTLKEARKLSEGGSNPVDVIDEEIKRLEGELSGAPDKMKVIDVAASKNIDIPDGAEEVYEEINRESRDD